MLRQGAAIVKLLLGSLLLALAAPPALAIDTGPGAPLQIVPEANAPDSPTADEGPQQAAPAEPAPTAEAPTAEAPAAPRVPEFLRRSNSRAGGPANELNTGDGRATEKLPEGSVGRMLAGRDLYHGNFCGPGAREGGTLAPTDALDDACRRHDDCYTRARGPNCDCDTALRREALTVASRSDLSRELRRRAASVAEATVLMECGKP